MLNNNSFLALFRFRLLVLYPAHQITQSLFAFSTPICYICTMWTKLIPLSLEQ